MFTELNSHSQSQIPAQNQSNQFHLAPTQSTHSRAKYGTFHDEFLLIRKSIIPFALHLKPNYKRKSDMFS